MADRPTDEVDFESHLEALDPQALVHDPEPDIVEALTSMVLHPDYPCLGAHSVFRRENATVLVVEDLEDEAAVPQVLSALKSFAAEVDHDEGFASFVAVFRQPEVRDEEHFEQLLWAMLQRLHDADHQPWNPDVSSDPANPHFAFSIAGTGFFVVGLHPQASRLARRAPLPTLVFNLHDQFEQLRASGKFTRMRDTIRRRDETLQGEPNPMVSDHGAHSEAAQYSGRAVGTDWHAPFEPHDAEELTS